MIHIELAQSEADALMGMPKVRTDDQVYAYPGVGGTMQIPLTSEDRREQFWLDIGRGRIEIRRGKYQLRGRQIVILARLDFGGPPHRNPDGTELPCPHLHLYRQGYGDKWAYPVPGATFRDLSDLWQTLHDFMDYCHVIDPPGIMRGMYV